MMRSASRLYSLYLLLVCLLMLPITGLAQTFRGGISGTVVDATGASVASAPVTAQNVDTNQIHQTTSSSAGTFIFQELPLGNYTVTVEASGFDKVRVEKVAVSAGQVVDLNIKVGVATQSTEVVVSADALSLDTATIANTATLSAQTVSDLPLNGRGYTQMVALTPGYAGYAGGQGFNGSLNGARRNQINWQIDGVDNNDFWHNEPAANEGGVSGLPGTTLPLDTVESFSVQTLSLPEAGRNPAGTVNLTLRSGTNHIHGTAYYYNRNELFGAKSPFTTTKQKVRNYNWGVSLGAPVIHNKLFFFGSFETQRFELGTSGLGTEPSVAYQTLALATLAKYNVSPNTVTKAMLATFWPANTLTGPATTGNFTSTVPISGHTYNGSVKFDYNINEKNTVSFHWFSGEGQQAAPSGSQIPDYYQTVPTRAQNYAIVWNNQISSRFSNQVLLGADYFFQAYKDANTNFNPIALGFNTGVTDISGAPNILLGASSQFDPIGPTPPLSRNGTTGHATDAFTLTLGAHDIRFGGEYRRGYVTENYHSNGIGQYVFDGAHGPWANDTFADKNIPILADFLAGYLASGTVARGNQAREVFVNSFGIFAQDAWKATQQLNFNYGVRYDYTGPLYNNNKDLSVFTPATGIVFQGDGIGSVFPPKRLNFSPRAGFTYEPSFTKGLVIRAAAGLYYDTPNINVFLSQSVKNGGAIGLQGNPAGAAPVFTLSVQPQTIVDGQLLAPLAATPATTCIVTTTKVSPCGVYTVSQNLRPGSTVNYSLNIQQQLGTNAVLQIGYVGSQARKQILLRDINQAALNPAGSSVAAYAKQSSRPLFAQYPTYGAVNELDSAGNANYNSLQTTLRLQNLHGVTSMFTYTWSHNLDNGTNYRSALPQDSTNIGADYGNSSYDITNNFKAIVNYDIPTLAKTPHWLTGGFELHSVFSIYGGEPVSIQSSADNSGTGEGSQRATQVLANPYNGASRSLVNGVAYWINPASFVNSPKGTFVTSRRTQVRGPGYNDVDFSVFKTGNVTEKLRLQFRAEMFNLFNRINYAPFHATTGSSLGQLTDTIGDYNGAPGIGPGEPFNVQFSLKALF
ncbi:TonB-dependent receptor domain-containing protein [Granulicella sibirica]|uniref:Oar protein n=1 Tax=Granulicella sibirica TaxID=2479048 RepID=A0A4Q0SYS8_9BACT|nr:TonB-dependent receptor [Granulicella sibirica]RXH54361.1 Oar protein [Granulicella sibirica]